jgi:hypothetical protein
MGKQLLAVSYQLETLRLSALRTTENVVTVKFDVAAVDAD